MLLHSAPLNLDASEVLLNLAIDILLEPSSNLPIHFLLKGLCLKGDSLKVIIVSEILLNAHYLLCLWVILILCLLF